MLLSGFFDNYLSGNDDIPPVLPRGEYVMNTYVIYKDRGNDEIYCAFDQIVPVGIGNNDDFIKMILWNGENTLHLNLLLNGFERP